MGRILQGTGFAVAHHGLGPVDGRGSRPAEELGLVTFSAGSNEEVEGARSTLRTSKPMQLVTNKSSSRSWRSRRWVEARCEGRGPVGMADPGSPWVREAVPDDEEP